jgi:hypothetical protein
VALALIRALERLSQSAPNNIAPRQPCFCAPHVAENDPRQVFGDCCMKTFFGDGAILLPPVRNQCAVHLFRAGAPSFPGYGRVKERFFTYVVKLAQSGEFKDATSIHRWTEREFAIAATTGPAGSSSRVIGSISADRRLMAAMSFCEARAEIVSRPPGPQVYADSGDRR